MTTRVLSQPTNDETGIRGRRRLATRGFVQGVGSLARLAAALRPTGPCAKDEVCAVIEAEGPAGALDDLTRRLRVEALAAAVGHRHRHRGAGRAGRRVLHHRRGPALRPPGYHHGCVSDVDRYAAELTDPSDLLLPYAPVRHRLFSRTPGTTAAPPRLPAGNDLTARTERELFGTAPARGDRPAAGSVKEPRVPRPSKEKV